jgi:protein ImuB
MPLARRRPLSSVVPSSAPPALGVVRAGERSGRSTPPALWLALRFAGFARQVFAAPDGPPFAVVEGEGARRAVVALDAAAAAHGVRLGHSVAAALALAPGLALVPRDPQREAAALARLAAWAHQFTPVVSLAPPDALLLEVRGSLNLFGGVEPLAARVVAMLGPLGYQAELALAPTPNAALWFARAGVPARILTLDELAGPLGALPLEVAGWDPGRVAGLAGSGIHHLRDLVRLPRDGLARRYGAALRADLDRALGRAPDPRPPFVAPLRFAGGLDLAHETASREWLGHAAGRLTAELAGGLAARGAGVRRLRLELRHREPPHTELVLGMLAPTRSASHLDRLLAERLARVALPAPVRALALEALEVETLGATALELFSARRATQAGAGSTPAALIETLRARLGADAVHGLACVADHRPERAWKGVKSFSFHALEDGGPVEGDGLDPLPPRPCWLFAEPRPLAALRGAPRLRGRPLELVAGPERIESGWWDGDDVARDYYLARAADGTRLWVFRTRRRPAAWFVHGLFA